MPHKTTLPLSSNGQAREQGRIFSQKGDLLFQMRPKAAVEFTAQRIRRVGGTGGCVLDVLCLIMLTL
jgi:hypothetical protein